MFLAHSPNYVCQESITRFTAASFRGSWTERDVVTVDLTYEDGREHYRNVTINGSPTRKPIEELPGNWSVGEFASDLAGPARRETPGESTSLISLGVARRFDPVWLRPSRRRGISPAPFTLASA